MEEKPRVFGCDHGITDVWAHIVIVDRDSVLVVKSCHHNRLALGGSVKGGGLGGINRLDVVGEAFEDGHSGRGGVAAHGCNRCNKCHGQ